MEIGLAEQGVFLLNPRLNPEQARERAWEQKGNAFGTLSKLLMRPRLEEIRVALLELRYQPFWHATAHKRFRYDRRAQYQIAVPGDVQTLDVAGRTYTPEAGRVALQGLDHCLFEERNEIFVDALSGEAGDLRRYLSFDAIPAQVGQALPVEGAVVPPEVRPAVIVRQVLGDVMHPASADEILEEKVVVERLNLYYRPVYAFEYVWEARSKRATVEVDALTGEFKPIGKAFGAQVKRVLTRDVLFDLGGETLNLVVPGGAIALKLTKALVDSQGHKIP